MQEVHRLLGNQGKQAVDLAIGVDNRSATPYFESKAKSLGSEHTFQRDVSDFGYLKDALRLISRELSLKLRFDEIYAHTITLKVK